MKPLKRKTPAKAMALLLAAAGLASALAGCGSPIKRSAPPPAPAVTAAPTPAPTPSPTPAPTPVPTLPPLTGVTAAGVGAGLPITVPASAPVDDSYFADAVFVGDSRTVGLQMYAGLDGARYFSGVGLSVSRAFSDVCVSMDGLGLTVAEALRRADYGKVYIMLGLNELGWPDEEAFADEYGRIIDLVQETHPDAVIYVQSILPVSRAKDASGNIYTNANVLRLQRALCRMCYDKGAHYLNVAEALQDSEGFLPSGLTPDGVHLSPEACGAWVDYLRTHTL